MTELKAALRTLGDGLSRLLRLGRPNAGRRRAELPDAMPAGSSSTHVMPSGASAVLAQDLEDIARGIRRHVRNADSKEKSSDKGQG